MNCHSIGSLRAVRATTYIFDGKDLENLQGLSKLPIEDQKSVAYIGPKARPSTEF